jgi:hypothetical protein
MWLITNHPSADSYVGRKKRGTGAAEVLEDLFQL